MKYREDFNEAREALRKALRNRDLPFGQKIDAIKATTRSMANDSLSLPDRSNDIASTLRTILHERAVAQDAIFSSAEIDREAEQTLLDSDFTCQVLQIGQSQRQIAQNKEILEQQKELISQNQKIISLLQRIADKPAGSSSGSKR